jgi:hypothetical protein
MYRGQDGALATSSAYTIPYFHAWQFLTLQYRLNNPERPNDRYRFEQGLPATYYRVEQEALKDKIVICEGAIKGMVTAIHRLDESYTTLAIPSKTTFSTIAEDVKSAGRVWIIPDPDAYDRPRNAPANWKPAPVILAERIGQTARIVRLPGKVDDMILAGEVDGRAWGLALDKAAKL